MKKLMDAQIKADNPHFGPIIRTVESHPYTSKEFDFTYVVVVGAYNSQWLDNLDAEPECDAWATYLWSPSKNAWVLGAN